ncbi:hypothetical protein BHE74_00024977 [Ensete ventricosum]|nr:hypothetical protein BHE74_00024977 [Ensete ventricosum]RZS09022.1 hypothetical protein BHM03_00040059 [Ensete ventricosum]
MVVGEPHQDEAVEMARRQPPRPVFLLLFFVIILLDELSLCPIFFFFFLCMNHVELFFPNTMQRHTYELIVAEFKDKKNGNNLILLEL